MCVLLEGKAGRAAFYSSGAAEWLSTGAGTLLAGTQPRQKFKPTRKAREGPAQFVPMLQLAPQNLQNHRGFQFLAQCVFLSLVH